MHVHPYVAPLAGVSLHLLPYGFNFFFPKREDGRIAERGRVAFRRHLDQYVDRRDMKLQRMIRVVLPDNVGMAVFLLAYYFSSKQYLIEAEDIPILLTAFLTIAVALHVFREVSFAVLSPLIEKTPFIGQPLAAAFKSFGPSDRTDA